MSTERRDFETMIQDGNWLILDTETTGLVFPSEVCQIAIIDPNGKTLIDELVNPVGTIPPDATRIHGIRNEDVKDARDWNAVFKDVKEILRNHDLVIYNSDYDTKLMNWSCKLRGIVYERTWVAEYCAMLYYANVWKEIDEYYGSYRWQKLSNAVAQQKLVVQDAHNALGDCLMTLALINKLAKNNDHA